MKLLRALLVTTLLLTVAAARAQEKAPPPPPPPPPHPQAQANLFIPVKVQVVFSEFDGEKKISSLPYMLQSMAEPERNPTQSSLRMGIRVPFATGNNQVQYQNVGTDVDCWVTSSAEGNFRLRLSLRRSSVYPTGSEGKETKSGAESLAAGLPVLREFNGSVTLTLRDGQTGQATVATDPVSGRTLKVDVTLNIAK